MHFNLIARTNGVGLDRDVMLVRDVLHSFGAKVTLSPARGIPAYHRWIPAPTKFHVNIFMERVFPRWLSSANKNFLIPNQERYPLRHVRLLNGIDQVLCKTQHAKTIFDKLHAKTCYIGFTSEDRNFTKVAPNYRRFFHLAGRSTLKGTETLLSIWAKHPEWPQLTLVQHRQNAPEQVPDNVELVTKYLEDSELRMLQNKHGIHLCPSRSEGWGHYIAEAMSVSAVTVTTHAPPMNELVDNRRGVLVPFNHTEPRHLGTNYYADPRELEAAIANLIKSPEEKLTLIGEKARYWFDENEESFRSNLKKWVKTLRV
ncbi:hypothetical protein Rhal01_01655 [Rubritalea halochordaticola]|uniref:Glycosyl transferase family 1 domain-containing protein n=1 Tax=Rubritalea halochordaticola TaxID=714537 RepID=A0ABP9UYJ7_9BACT